MGDGGGDRRVRPVMSMMGSTTMGGVSDGGSMIGLSATMR